jgi:hypothetical protein
MRSNDPKTPLLALLRALTDEERQKLADKAETSLSYLYALATCQRGSCRSALAKRIADATVWMHKETKGQTEIVTMEQLATMCSGCEA